MNTLRVRNTKKAKAQLNTLRVRNETNVGNGGQMITKIYTIQYNVNFVFTSRPRRKKTSNIVHTTVSE